MTNPKVALVEVFASVQGEGFNAGRDAVFVRLSGCNLSCVFADGVYCDTPYQQMNLKPSLDELFEEAIPRLCPPPHLDRATKEVSTMLILTGGEPTHHPAFDALTVIARAKGYYVAVETNGTRWRTGLKFCDWITVSPKDDVQQGSPARYHNHNPQSSALDPKVVQLMEERAGEYRYVISGPHALVPLYRRAERHYLSPAVKSDGSGEEWKTGFPGFVDGAVERCLEIIAKDPRWRLSIQTHKVLRVR